MIYFVNTNNQEDVITAIPMIRNNLNCVYLSMVPGNRLKQYNDISNFIVIANNIISQAGGTTVGTGVKYTDPSIANSIYENPDFDRHFMYCIDSMISSWLSMMTIMINVYEGNDAIIEYGTDELSYKVVESLIKIIQEKYQYNCVIVNCIDDVYCCNESSFGPAGLLKLDEERRRYQELVISGKIDYIIGDIPKK